MRFGMMGVAAAALLTAAPAVAATIVQVQYDESPFGFNPFNTRLGSLNSVSLNVSTTRYYDWQVRGPDTVNVFTGTYVINAEYGVFVSGIPTLVTPLIGSGSFSVATESRGNGYSFATVPLMSTGNATFALNPVNFVGANLLFINGTDRAFQGGPGIVITSPQADRTIPQRSCFGVSRNEDLCGVTQFTLSYDYTPLFAPVPEPATWAMMILGMGVVGYAMRRRIKVSEVNFTNHVRAIAGS